MKAYRLGLYTNFETNNIKVNPLFKRKHPVIYKRFDEI